MPINPPGPGGLRVVSSLPTMKEIPMEKPVLIRFVGMAPSTAIEYEIHAQVAYLAPL